MIILLFISHSAVSVPEKDKKINDQLFRKELGSGIQIGRMWKISELCHQTRIFDEMKGIL